MALLTKPNMQQVWASGGDIVEPSDLKKQQGWTVEVPPHQFENWIQNRQDEYLAHVNQRGIPEWDGNTEYEAAGLSYVQGSDGVVYKSVAVSGPTTTAQDPTTDVSDTYWKKAFAPAANPPVTLTATTVLTQTSIGSIVYLNPSAVITITLPPVAGVPDGSTIRLVVIKAATAATVSVILAAAAGTTAVKSTGATIDTPMYPGDTVEFTLTGTQWRMTGGSMVLFDSITALGGYRGRRSITSTIAMDSSYAGTITNIGASGITITLPASGSVHAGQTVCFENDIGNVTISAIGGDTISTNGVVGITTIPLGQGETLILESNQLGTWRVIGGSGQLPFSPNFAAQKATNGYQKLPSGVIVQWGTANVPAGGTLAVTFPIAFPTQCDNVVSTCNTGGPSSFLSSVGVPTSGGFNQFASNSTSGAGMSAFVFWHAVGR